jgi:hypothetical protein
MTAAMPRPRSRPERRSAITAPAEASSPGAATVACGCTRPASTFAQIVETCDLVLDEGLIGEVVERPAPPQRKRLLERRGRALGASRRQLAPTLRHEPLETVRVQALGIDHQLVATLARHDHAGRAVAGPTRQRLAQAGDLHLHRLGGLGRWTLAPQLVDQPVRAELLACVPAACFPRARSSGPRRGPRADQECGTPCQWKASRLNRTYRSPRPSPSRCCRLVTAPCPRRDRCPA